MEIVLLDDFKNKKLFTIPKHKIDTEFLDYQKDRYELINGKKS